LLVGGEGGSFASDLRRLPMLTFNFFATVPRKFRQIRKGAEQERLVDSRLS